MAQMICYIFLKVTSKNIFYPIKLTMSACDTYKDKIYSNYKTTVFLEKGPCLFVWTLNKHILNNNY